MPKSDKITPVKIADEFEYDKNELYKSDFKKKLRERKMLSAS